MSKEERDKETFNVSFHADFTTDLKRDAEKLGVSSEEFIKICIVLGTIFAEHHEKGAKIFIHEADGNLIELMWRNP